MIFLSLHFLRRYYFARGRYVQSFFYPRLLLLSCLVEFFRLKLIFNVDWFLINNTLCLFLSHFHTSFRFNSMIRRTSCYYFFKSIIDVWVSFAQVPLNCILICFLSLEAVQIISWTWTEQHIPLGDRYRMSTGCLDILPHISSIGTAPIPSLSSVQDTHEFLQE